MADELAQVPDNDAEELLPVTAFEEVIKTTISQPAPSPARTCGRRTRPPSPAPPSPSHPAGKRKGHNPSLASIYRALAEHDKAQAYPEAIEQAHADFAALPST
jgi:hypothetical protein